MLIEDDNLSRAWSRALLEVIDHAGTIIAPLCVTLRGGPEGQALAEDATVRQALDACLAANHKRNIEGVAAGIFPQSLWRAAQFDRHRFYDRYLLAAPRYKAMNHAQNGRGLYFERLIAWGSGPFDGNQLEWMLSQYHARAGVRQTMFQASLFDPARDHVASAQLGFPCLQHINFVPQANALSMNAFYATQQLFDKAYGNWLGLWRLGSFMAHEMALPLVQLNCFIGVEKLERIGKTNATLQPVISAARALVAAPTEVPVLSLNGR